MAEHRDNLARFRALAERRLEASRLRRDIPLAPYTTFRIGGPADLLYDATTADDLANAVETCREAELPHFVLGLGANILVGDKGFRGAVIRNVAREFRYDGSRLWAESGAVMQDLILSSVHRGLSGLEHYIGIPSTVHLRNTLELAFFGDGSFVCLACQSRTQLRFRLSGSIRQFAQAGIRANTVHGHVFARHHV